MSRNTEREISPLVAETSLSATSPASRNVRPLPHSLFDDEEAPQSQEEHPVHNNTRTFVRNCAFALLAVCTFAYGSMLVGGAISTRHSGDIGVPSGLLRENAQDDKSYKEIAHTVQKKEVTWTAEGSSADDLSNIDQVLLSFLSKSSFARDKMINLLVNEYISENSPDTDMADRLDNAIETMELVESDGEPVQVEGYPFLFVGSIGASYNEEALKRNGVTHVINWSPSAKCNAYENIEYLCYTNVMNYKDMKRHMDELAAAVEFIESARISGGKSMSQCWYGRNRSVTTLVAYLMKYEDMDAIDAWRLIKQTRDIADPYQDVLYYYCVDELGREEDVCDCFWDP